MKRSYKERRLYFSQGCERCGRRFQSFKRARIKNGLCRKCRKINPDQASLFDEVKLVTDEVSEKLQDSVVRSIKSVDITDKGIVTTIIGEQPDGGFGISQSLSPECSASPSGTCSFDPSDHMCLYCGRGEK